METMKIIKRKIVDEIITSYSGKKIIKVLTGIRRCGKSFILRQIRDSLIDIKNYSKDEIIYTDLEDLKNSNLLNYKSLHQYINNKAKDLKNKRACLLFDEIQEVENWEKCINSLYSQENFFYDIYITGSNAKLLSTELSTLISGRFVNINIYPLSYVEFLRLNDFEDSEQSFNKYIKYGGFPGLNDFLNDDNALNNYLGGIYSIVLLKDVVAKNKIRDVNLLEKLIKYIFENVGNIFSGKKICDFLKNEKRSLSVETIYNYITYLLNALCIFKVDRFDIKGKHLLETMEKYYLADWGLKNYLLGFSDKSISGILENIVYIELLRRGYNVKIGKLDDTEIDFIAEKNGKLHYYQVAYLLSSQQTKAREYEPLNKLKDSFPKTILTLDALPPSDENGIARINIREFLLNNSANVATL